MSVRRTVLTAVPVAAAVVLAVALVLWLGDGEPTRAATPAPSVPPSSAPATVTPTPTPTPAAKLSLRRHPVVPVVRGAAKELGPPPGPRTDRVPAATAAPKDRYAVLAGVTHYRSPTHDTIGSVADVKLFRSMLLKAGWQSKNIHVLTDDQVTGKALRWQLAWLAARSRPGTFTLFHWSGHVKQLGGTHEALWPVDREFVDDVAVKTLLRKGSGKMWVDIAGCEAASFSPGLSPSRVLFTGSSKGSQKSYEYPDWGLSVWTGLLLDLGTRQQGADADRDGRVTMGEALRYATYYAQGITLTQEPYGRQTPQVLGDRAALGWTLDAPPA